VDDKYIQILVQKNKGNGHPRLEGRIKVKYL
jgi:hypothetical protein